MDPWERGREGRCGRRRGGMAIHRHRQTPHTHSLSSTHQTADPLLITGTVRAGRSSTYPYILYYYILAYYILYTTSAYYTVLYCNCNCNLTITIAAAAAGSTPLDRRQGALQCRAVDGRTFVRLFVCSCVLYCNCTVLYCP